MKVYIFAPVSDPRGPRNTLGDRSFPDPGVQATLLLDVREDFADEINEYLTCLHGGGPFCEACRESCAVKVQDFGIGPYEYWGAKGVDVQLAVVSTCCEADVWEDYACKKRRYEESDICEPDYEPDDYDDYDDRDW